MEILIVLNSITLLILIMVFLLTLELIPKKPIIDEPTNFKTISPNDIVCISDKEINQMALDFYKETKKLPSMILVDKNNNLLSGFDSYRLAKLYGLKQIKVYEVK